MILHAFDQCFRQFSDKTLQKSGNMLTLFGLRGEGKMALPEGFAKYLKNSLTDLHQSL